MSEPGPDSEIRARVVFFGPSGAGTSENVRYIQRKLRSEHRGELTHVEGTGGSYETLPIELGSVGGHKTSIHLSTVPTGDDANGERRQLLANADGVVFVADLRPTRHDATVRALGELREHIEANGRQLGDIVLIVQYNFRDLADENAVEALHRRLEAPTDAVFEAVASEGTGVLQTLTSLSKLIVRRVRQRDGETTDASDSPIHQVAASAAAAVGVDVEPADDDASKPFEIASAGPAETSGSEVRVPVSLVESETGRTIQVCLRLSLEPA